MSTQDIINTSEECLLKTYNRYPIVFDHGEGVRLYDADGKEYDDEKAVPFVNGILNKLARGIGKIKDDT